MYRGYSVFFFNFPLYIVGVFFQSPAWYSVFSCRGTRYIVGKHMWWIVVEIRRGKHDGTSWFGTQHMYMCIKGY